MNRVVLVVDDEQELRKLLTVQLRREGFNVYSAESAEKALELLKSGIHVDAVVSDIRMPGGMSGVDFIKTLREEKIILPVNILMSGHAILQPDEINNLDIDHCFSKPFSVKKLAGVLNQKLSTVDESKSPRKHPRVQSQLDVAEAVEEEFLSKTMDVSLGGVFIRMDSPLPIGTRFSVQIDLDPAFIVELEVKWARGDSGATKPSGVGCEFVNLSSDDENRLKGHLEGIGSGPTSLLEMATNPKEPKENN